MAEGRMLNPRKSVPLHLQYAVIGRDGTTCQYCGKIGVFVMRYGKPAVVENVGNIQGLSEMEFYNGRGVIKFEIDHIVPVFKGGENVINNLILSCRRCNRAKRDR